MSDQARIAVENGETVIDRGPLTADGEPMFHPATVAERPELFGSAAFVQMRGQLALETDGDGEA